MEMREAWPNKSGAREQWRQVLAQSNQEMLREMLSQAAGTSGAGRSMEKIAMEVADRMLDAHASLLPEESDDIFSRAVSPQSDPAMLNDVKAVPWSVWSGEEDNGDKLAPNQPTARDSADLAERRVSRPSVKGVDFADFYRDEDEQGGSNTATMTAGLRLFTTTQQHTWMKWHRKPKTVMLVAKKGDPEVATKLREIAVWIDSQGLTLVLEPDLLREIRGEQARCRSPRPKRHEVCGLLSSSEEDLPAAFWGWGKSDDLPPGFVDRCRTFSPDHDELEQSIDVVVTIGGDGTLCWAAGLFGGAMPPVVPFAGGSLGFLTPFCMNSWVTNLAPLLGASCKDTKPVQLVCRMRFQMRVMRASVDRDGSGGPSLAMPHIPVQALNEVLVHRGSSGHLVKLEICVNNCPVTMVQGDGLILATPTGSTAYSLAAGGSMMHPSVPGIILTPVCPHSLSFRPVVLPDSAVVRVRMPASARSSKVMVAVDGKDRIELFKGDAIEVTVSPYPLPTVCESSVTEDWFLSVNGALQWNLRLEQKTLNTAQVPGTVA